MIVNVIQQSPPRQQIYNQCAYITHLSGNTYNWGVKFPNDEKMYSYKIDGDWPLLKAGDVSCNATSNTAKYPDSSSGCTAFKGDYQVFKHSRGAGFVLSKPDSAFTK